MRISGNGDLYGSWVPKQIASNRPESAQQGQKSLPPQQQTGTTAMPSIARQKQAARMLDQHQASRSSHSRYQAQPQGQLSFSARQAIDSYQAHVEQDQRQQLSHMLGVDEYV